ncbi:penicillin-binding protein 2 [Candidatus Peregrinibacteria bacterium]|nr:penicillin-binding protein 2 [Candidatus Peregrinibacteria bacterium]
MNQPFPHSYRNSAGENIFRNRLFSLAVFVSLLFLIVIGRLFQLQVFKYRAYSKIAEEQHFGAIELPAKRGEILVRDSHSGELSKLATNTTLDLLYVDPIVAEDKAAIAKALSPLLFTPEEYENCKKKPDECRYNVIRDEPAQSFLTTEPVWDLGLGASSPMEPADEEARFREYGELVEEVEENILRKIMKTEVDFVILRRDADRDLMADIINEQLPGVFVDTKRFLVYADPTLIPENRIDAIAQRLSAILNEPVATMRKAVSRRTVRYVFLKNKLDPEISRTVKELDLKGVVLIPEHWRYYPENELASNVIGFLSREGVGQYGIEGYFNTELEGKKGRIYAESDPFGRQITVGESEIVNAVNGDSIVLTIDRVVQKNVEKILKEDTERFRADSGQVIVMDPFTGAIVAMANYPSFNPNAYTEVYEVRELAPGEEEEIRKLKTVPLFKQDEKGRYVPLAEEDAENKEIKKYVYENRFGPGALKNKTISEFYEPGSVFKAIIMSIALDAKEVEPQTTFDDTGPLKIDEFEIKNSTNLYWGLTTMTGVLEKSLNTGMSWVAKKIGRQLMYKYLKDFGFGAYTNIFLEGETKGRLDYYTHWSKAQLLTQSFGQGIIVTPIQMITSWAALANGGKLVMPYIVESIIRENEVVKSEPQVVHRVISEETSSIITSMLISVVRRGYGHQADIPGYLVAGKTGSSQIAGSDGKYETGEGALITSFAGYFPAYKPRFIMLIKFDRPRFAAENTWGENTAAVTFRKIAEFLIDYYHIEPGE